MSRIPLVSAEHANAEQQALYAAIQAELGVVPNFLKVFAHSPDALRAFLGLYGIAKQGSLAATTRERIALAIAQQNSCEYCLSAHTALGKKAGLNHEEIEANRAGSSLDEREAVAVALLEFRDHPDAADAADDPVALAHVPQYSIRRRAGT